MAKLISQNSQDLMKIKMCFKIKHLQKILEILILYFGKICVKTVIETQLVAVYLMEMRKKKQETNKPLPPSYPLRSLPFKTCEGGKKKKTPVLPHTEQSSLTCKTRLLSYYVHRSNGVNLGTWHKKEEGRSSRASRAERLECSVCLKIGFTPWDLPDSPTNHRWCFRALMRSSSYGTKLRALRA